MAARTKPTYGIQHKALELHQGDEEFSDSRGSLEKFFWQYDFFLKRKTTVYQKTILLPR